MLSPQKWEENYLKRLQSRRGLEVNLPHALDLPEPNDADVLLQHAQPIPDGPLYDRDAEQDPSTLSGALSKRTSSTPLLSAPVVPRHERQAGRPDPHDSSDEEAPSSMPMSTRAKMIDERGIQGCISLWKRDRSAFWGRVKSRWPYYTVPIVLWIQHYNWRRDLPADFIAALGVAAMLVPQSLAYAILAGLPPIQGLYTALFPALIFACMTTSRHIHFGPDALAALLVGVTIIQPNYAKFDPQLVAAVFSFLCGVVMLLLGIFRFGFLDNVLSRPLLAGFVNAVAVLIMLNQVEPLLGLGPSHTESAYSKIVYLIDHIHETHPLAAFLGFVSLGILIALRVYKSIFSTVRWLKFAIDPLIVVIFGIVVSAIFDVEKRGVRILGDVPSTFPLPSLPSLNYIEAGNASNLLMDTTVIAIIGFVETIVAAKIYSNKYSYAISPNRELVAMGAANIVGSFFGTFPCFASLTRSAMADFLGARTQIYTLLVGVFVLFTLLFLGPIVAFLPRVCMASIICVAAYSLFEFEDVRFLWELRAWKEQALLWGTFIVTLILGVDLGIFLGIGLSLLLVVAHSSLPSVIMLARTNEGKWVDASQNSDAAMHPDVAVVRIEESLYFANVEAIKGVLMRVEIFGTHLAHPSAQREERLLRGIVIHGKHVSGMDATAIAILHELQREYQKRGVILTFVKISKEIQQRLQRGGVLPSPPHIEGQPPPPPSETRVFDRIDDAVMFILSLPAPTRSDLKGSGDLPVPPASSVPSSSPTSSFFGKKTSPVESKDNPDSTVVDLEEV